MMILKHLGSFVVALVLCLAVPAFSQPASPVNDAEASTTAVAAPESAESTNADAGVVTNLPPRQDRVAKLGDPAMPIYVEEWIKGRPVKIQPGSNIYVLVFCSLSRANEFALTNLSQLQNEYRDKGVTVLAVSGEAPETVKQFVLLNGRQITFSVAADRLPGRTAQNYLHAFRQMQLPHAFIVDTNAEVVWHGHPLTDGMGQVVDELVNGRFSLSAVDKKVIAREQMDQYLMFARMNDERAADVGKLLMAFRYKDAPALVEMAFKIATDGAIDDDKRDVPLVNAVLNRVESISDTNTTDVGVIRSILLFMSGHPDEGVTNARALLATTVKPDEKKEIEATIRAMEVRMEITKSNKLMQAASTNSVSGNSPSNAPANGRN